MLDKVVLKDSIDSVWSAWMGMGIEASKEAAVSGGLASWYFSNGDA